MHTTVVIVGSEVKCDHEQKASATILTTYIVTRYWYQKMNRKMNQTFLNLMDSERK
jgi:hypothetical protein